MRLSVKLIKEGNWGTAKIISTYSYDQSGYDTGKIRSFVLENLQSNDRNYRFENQHETSATFFYMI